MTTLCLDGARHRWDSRDRSHARCKVCNVTRRQVNQVRSEAFRKLEQQPAIATRLSAQDSMEKLMAAVRRGVTGMRRAA